MSKVLWEWISNVGSKARESTKAMSLAFVLLDFQHAGVREVSRTRTIYSTETHTSGFILNTFRYGKPVQFFPGEVLSVSDGEPREQVLQQSSEFSGEVG